MIQFFDKIPFRRLTVIMYVVLIARTDIATLLNLGHRVMA